MKETQSRQMFLTWLLWEGTRYSLTWPVGLEVRWLARNDSRQQHLLTEETATNQAALLSTLSEAGSTMPISVATLCNRILLHGNNGRLCHRTWNRMLVYVIIISLENQMTVICWGSLLRFFFLSFFFFFLFFWSSPCSRMLSSKLCVQLMSPSLLLSS